MNSPLENEPYIRFFFKDIEDNLLKTEMRLKLSVAQHFEKVKEMIFVGKNDMEKDIRFFSEKDTEAIAEINTIVLKVIHESHVDFLINYYTNQYLYFEYSFVDDMRRKETKLEWAPCDTFENLSEKTRRFFKGYFTKEKEEILLFSSLMLTADYLEDKITIITTGAVISEATKDISSAKLGKIFSFDCKEDNQFLKEKDEESRNMREGMKLIKNDRVKCFSRKAD